MDRREVPPGCLCSALLNWTRSSDWVIALTPSHSCLRQFGLWFLGSECVVCALVELMVYTIVHIYLHFPRRRRVAAFITLSSSSPSSPSFPLLSLLSLSTPGAEETTFYRRHGVRPECHSPRYHESALHLYRGHPRPHPGDHQSAHWDPRY